MRVLINASNLRVGGGVQVAASFISELASIDSSHQFDILVSSVVDRNLRSMGVNSTQFSRYSVCDWYGLIGALKMPFNYFNSYDVVFTVFGPLYSFRKPKISIVGFAQPWIIYFDKIASRLSFLKKNYLRFRFWLQYLVFRRADVFVVELEHVRDGLVSLGVNRDKVLVVNNTISSLYSNRNLWLPVLFPEKSGGANLKIGYVGRNYFHKNTAILPKVRDVLIDNYGLSVDFFVTFTKDEWDDCDGDFKAAIINVGSLNVSQCPDFYEKVDAVIFPSLLECFSVTPLEAMVMKKPLFASDRGFVRDVCKDYAMYFDPDDPASVAATIADYYLVKKNNCALLEEAASYANNYMTAKRRAEQYVDSIVFSSGFGSDVIDNK